jgi:hypothetical protein
MVELQPKKGSFEQLSLSAALLFKVNEARTCPQIVERRKNKQKKYWGALFLRTIWIK